MLVYGAYVAEVYRAGLESIHWSQTAAARSLGLSQWQTLRYVVIPQAVRRIMPPLLNDFVALQKDTALVIGRRRRRRSCNREHPERQPLQPVAGHRRGHVLPRHHDPADPLRRLPDRRDKATDAGALSAFLELHDVHKRFGENEVLSGVT